MQIHYYNRQQRSTANKRCRKRPQYNIFWNIWVRFSIPFNFTVKNVLDLAQRASRCRVTCHSVIATSWGTPSPYIYIYTGMCVCDVHVLFSVRNYEFTHTHRHSRRVSAYVCVCIMWACVQARHPQRRVCASYYICIYIHFCFSPAEQSPVEYNNINYNYVLDLLQCTVPFPFPRKMTEIIVYIYIYIATVMMIIIYIKTLL